MCVVRHDRLLVAADVHCRSSDPDEYCIEDWPPIEAKARKAIARVTELLEPFAEGATPAAGIDPAALPTALVDPNRLAGRALPGKGFEGCAFDDEPRDAMIDVRCGSSTIGTVGTNAASAEAISHPESWISGIAPLPQRDSDDFELSPTDGSRVVEVVPVHGMQRGRAERRLRCSSRAGTCPTPSETPAGAQRETDGPDARAGRPARGSEQIPPAQPPVNGAWVSSNPSSGRRPRASSSFSLSLVQSCSAWRYERRRSRRSNRNATSACASSGSVVAIDRFPSRRASRSVG